MLDIGIAGKREGEDAKYMRHDLLGGMVRDN